MPYNRTYKKRVPKARGQSKVGYALTVASKALKTALLVKSLINVEMHKKDISPGGIVIPTSGDIQLLNGIAQGDRNENREGSSVRLKYLQLKGTLSGHASATSTRVRFLLVIDKNPRMLLTTIADILDTSTNLIHALRNKDNLHRYHVLRDFITIVGTGGNTNQEKNINFYKKFNKIIKFEDGDTSALITAIRNNALLLVMIGDEATNVPIFTYTSRIGFIDN